MKIYTRSGDDGTTGLLGGDRTQKTSERIEAIGDVDELNALLGVAAASGQDSLIEGLERIQHWLFDVGAELACPPGGKFDFRRIGPPQTARLEQSIDEMTANLPELKAFILPGGSLRAAYLHQSRAGCRRAERSLLCLSELEEVREEVKQFMNRLSDWLLVAARTANAECRVMDITWRPREES